MSRPATPTLVSTGALCLAFLLTSCGTADTSPGASQETVPAAPSSAAPTPSPTMPSPTTTEPAPSATAAPTTAAPTSAPADLVTYTTSDSSLSFDHPTEWTIVEDPVAAPPNGVSLVVNDDAGRQLATLQTNLITGAECSQKVPYSVIDSEPMPALAVNGETPTYRFESRDNPLATDPVEMTTFAYGITSAPAPTGPEACPLAHFFTWPPSGAAFTGIYDPFDTSPGRPMHVDTPHAYTETDEYQKIRAMITSLRPAA